VGQHGGRLIDTAGDRIPAGFPSVIGATVWAIEIQRVMAARNEHLPDRRRMLFRIGDRLGSTFEDLGERELKNIPRPVRVFRLSTAATSKSLPVPTAGGSSEFTLDAKETS
jgi:adenylate cyclase